MQSRRALSFAIGGGHLVRTSCLSGVMEMKKTELETEKQFAALLRPHVADILSLVEQDVID